MSELTYNNKNSYRLRKHRYISTEYDRNIFHILNCQLCGTCELRQILMVAPSSLFLCIYFRYDMLQSWFGLVHSVHLLLIRFCKLVNHSHFMLHWNDAVLDRKSLLLKIISEAASFWYNIKWAQNTLCVALTDFLVLKNVSTANAQCAPVHAMIIIDHIWKKNGKTFARCRFHYHLSNYTCTTRLTV